MFRFDHAVINGSENIVCRQFFKPTGAFGLAQIEKLEAFIDIRRENADFWNNALSDLGHVLVTHTERPGTRHVWFAYPITVRSDAAAGRNAGVTRDGLMSFLESRHVETRPIMAGNMAMQPAMRYYDHRKSGNLPHSTQVMRGGISFGNHQGVEAEAREYVADMVEGFMAERSLG